jgi:hypothetical protein
VDDQVTSLTGVAGSAQNGPVAFTTTHWSVVLAAQGSNPAAQAALDKLATLTGDQFMVSSHDRASDRKRQKISLRVSLRFYLNGGI